MNDSARHAVMVELTAAQTIADHAVKAGRELNDSERARIDEHLGRVSAIKAGNARGDLRRWMRDVSTDVGAVPDGAPVARRAGRRGKSLGQAFVESKEYTDLLATVPGGRFSDQARVQSAPFAVKALITGGSETSAGALTSPDDYGLLDPSYARTLTLRSLITTGTTTSDAIEYVRLMSTTNAAAPVAEATSSAPPTAPDLGGALTPAAGGGYKPESEMVFEKDVANVKTIAHWMPATKRALSDAAQIRTLIDNFLLYGLEEELEDQIAAGDGNGENFLGILNTPGIQVQPAAGAGETVFDTTRKARTKVKVTGRANPSAYVFHPIDWEKIELTKNAQDVYYGAGPFAMTEPRLWGLPVLESEAVPAGTALVADWTKAVLWDREQASVQITDSHADFFIRNLVAILAELRAAFAVLVPPAFCKMTV